MCEILYMYIYFKDSNKYLELYKLLHQKLIIKFNIKNEKAGLTISFLDDERNFKSMFGLEKQECEV